jgi:hypothetical protein
VAARCWKAAAGANTWLQVQDPLSTLRDVDELTYVSRGASSVVFQGSTAAVLQLSLPCRVHAHQMPLITMHAGVWQGSEVAVKFLISDMSIHSASAREALLCKELAHPHIVQCYAGGCCTPTASPKPSATKLHTYLPINFALLSSALHCVAQLAACPFPRPSWCTAWVP